MPLTHRPVRHAPVRPGQARGFSLIELMVAVAIVAILSAIALPLYEDYVETARIATLRSNIDSMRIFQEDQRLRTGAYAAGTYDAAGGTTTLTTNLGWEPQDASDDTVYVVTIINGGANYRVVATDAAGTSLTLDLP